MPEWSPRATSTESDPVRTDPDVQEFLHRFAWAITSGDGRAAATLWALPTLIIGDDSVQTVMDRDELERMLGGVRQHYNATGIHDTRAEIQQVEWWSERMALVHVRWPHLDASGQERGAEHSTYLLRRDDQGELRVHVAVTRRQAA